MFTEALVNQEATGGLDILWIILPVLLCVILMGQGRGGGGKRESTHETVYESWYTPQDNETTYKTIEAIVTEWRKEAEEKSEASKGALSSLRGILSGGKPEARFVVKETIPPRLYRMSDPTGPIYFELTEVEGGGSVVKATFSSDVRSKMAKFKASLPLKIPAAPIGNRCPACGKPVLPEFNLCPYCGEKIIKV
ncbi:MAG: zinc ribbon domain-containing protein [Candidatus Bathyarchaeota archaeon]|nr:zinc ribbon domain-containing protein [Candidatus Bathyarchaeota archaeon]